MESPGLFCACVSLLSGLGLFVCLLVVRGSVFGGAGGSVTLFEV